MSRNGGARTGSQTRFASWTHSPAAQCASTCAALTARPTRWRGAYLEIVEPERLIFTSSALDAQGRPLFEVLTTVTLAEHGGKTTLTVHAKVLSATAQAALHLAGMDAGWAQTLERLQAHVEKR